MTQDEIICHLRLCLDEKNYETKKLRLALYMALSGDSTCVDADNNGIKEKDCKKFNTSDCVDCRYCYMLDKAEQELSAITNLTVINKVDKRLCN